MKLTTIILVLFILGGFSSQIQADEIEDISAKYRQWILGNEQTDYTNPHIQGRYQAILNYAENAEKKYDKFTFDTSSQFDFSTKDNQKEARTIFAEILFPLSLAYHLPGDPNNANPYYQDKNTKAKIIYLFKYLREKGWKNGIDMQYKSMDTYKETGVVGFGGSMGNNFLGYSISLFLNKELLKEEKLLNNELRTLEWISNVVGPGEYDFPKLWEVNGYNADGIRAMFNNRLCYVLSLPINHENRSAEANYFSRLFNKSMQIADGWADLIKSDYMGYHHKNAYLSAYAPNAFHSASLMMYLLEGTSLQVDETAKSNLANAILMSRIYSNKYDCPRGLAGRFPDNLGALIRNLPSFAYMASIETPYKEEMKSAFKRLWEPTFENFRPDYVESVGCKIMYHGSIGAMQLTTDMAAQNISAENDPNGYWFFPYGGLSIYRQGNWLASFKGNSKYIWDFESSGTENNYGRYASAGVLRLLAGGSPVSAKGSGYTVDGWNWNRLPNATTLDMPYDDMKSKKTRNFTPESFLGGVHIASNNGLVSMKYDAPLSHLSLNKSFFFIDDYIVAIGSNINAPDETYDVHTTLFQNGIANLKVSNSLNGISLKGESDQEIKNEKIYLTDAQGHAYYIPGNVTLSLERQKQSAPLDHGKSNKSGYYASARLLHGQEPDDASYLYCIQVNGKEAGAKNLADNFNNMFAIIQQDATAHIIKHQKSNTTAYALMNANTNTKDELLEQTDTPCLVMITKKGTKEIKLAIQNPELGKIDEPITYGEISQNWHASSTIQAVTLTLKGNWEIKSETNQAEVLEYKDGNTLIRFNCFDGKAITVELKNDPNTATQTIDQSIINIYPNPVKAGEKLFMQGADYSASATLFSYNGQALVQASDFNATGLSIPSNLTNGYYLVKIKSDNQPAETYKVLIL